MKSLTNSPSLRNGRRIAAAIIAAAALVAPVTLATAAQAVAPPAPVAAPFDAPQCENTVGDPSSDADGGPVSNLLSVFGQRLADYNAGKPVILYNNIGRSGWTSGGSQYSSNPLCATRYVAEAGGPVSSWIYCTFDRASTCGWTNVNGELERSGTVLPGLEYKDPDARLTADQQKLQSYIIQNDLPVLAGPDGSGGTLGADAVANNSTSQSRALRQNLVHCIDNPERNSALVFCENNMSASTQNRILQLIGADRASMLAALAVAPRVDPGAEGKVVLTTTLAGLPLQVAASGGSITLCGGPATLSGSTLQVDADATLPAELTFCVNRPDSGTFSIEVSGTPPVLENIGFMQSARYDGDTLCQIFSTVADEQQQVVSTRAAFEFRVSPSIGTSLVDAADGDRLVDWRGGTVLDTVQYQNLTPGVEYTLVGELMHQADGTGTGITGTVTFTPTTPEGTVVVNFVIPEGYAGKKLVAFERLFEGADSSGAPIATHEDLHDAAQTVSVNAAPAGGTPGTPQTTPNNLARTGSFDPAPALAVASALALLGAVALVSQRRKNRS